MMTKSKTGKNIPISAAKSVGVEYGYNQIIIHGYDSSTGVQCVATYGKSVNDCINAAKGGNAIKKLLGWPEELCDAKPKRLVNKLNKINKVIDDSELIYTAGKALDSESFKMMVEELKTEIAKLV